MLRVAEGYDVVVPKVNGRPEPLFAVYRRSVRGEIEKMLSRNSRIEQICVMGSGLKQPIALVVPGEGNNAEDSTLISELAATLNDVNAKLESHQRLDYLFICKEPWTIENDLLTPTLKLKRGEIEHRYSARLPAVIKTEIVVE